MNEFYMSKNKKLYILLILIGSLVYGLTKLISSGNVFISQEFDFNRKQSALIAQDIVNLSTEIKNDISKINNLDEEKKYKEAFNLLNETNLKILNIRQKAVELSRSLEIMAKELNNIKAKGNEILAISAITHRLTIISRLINYSDYLFQLNLALQKRFYGADNKEEIETLIKKINNEVIAINETNQKANEAMQKFDEAILK